MIYAGIVAGGTGSRMGLDIPKQFAHIGDKPIIIYAAEKFASHVNNIYIACPSEHIEYTKELFYKYTDIKNIHIVQGGKSRMGSVLNIVSQIIHSYGVNNDDIILTHDGVRPFVSEEIIIRNINAAKKFSVCGTFCPAIDTIAVSTDGKSIQAVPPRDTMYNVQTPQTFKLSVLKKMLAMSGENIEQYTDLCGMAMGCGYPVHIVLGDEYNIKLTSPIDMHAADAILNK